MKFAMLGDRYDNDIDPPIRLLTKQKLLTLKLQSEKYWKNNSMQYAQTAPDFIVYTLAQAKAILLDPSNWQAKACADDPPVFNWTISKEIDKIDTYEVENDLDDQSNGAIVGLSLLLDGINMPSQEYPTSHRICARILAEYIALSDMKDSYSKHSELSECSC